MTPTPATFDVATHPAGDEAFLSLEAEFNTGKEPDRTRHRTYLDTFDWRLHHYGATLIGTPSGSGVLLTLNSADGGSQRLLRLDDTPVFARDLPEGSFRERVSEIVEIRRLFPVVAVARSSRVLPILDTEEKTVARVLLERSSAVDPSKPGPPRELPTRLVIEPVKGYAAAHARLVEFAEKILGLERVGGNELATALETIGRRPGDYSSKLEIALQPTMRADEATMAVHRALLDTILANEVGVREGLDSEFLHDFRVAARRTRATLRQIQGRLSARHRRPFQRRVSLARHRHGADARPRRIPVKDGRLPRHPP